VISYGKHIADLGPLENVMSTARRSNWSEGCERAQVTIGNLTLTLAFDTDGWKSGIMLEQLDNASMQTNLVVTKIFQL